MSIFKDMLKQGETLFKNEVALDPEWVPKLLPFRDNQQFRIAACIKPLLQDRNGKNCIVYGAPGIGKTAATKWVLRDLEENTDDIHPIYVNCWQKNTTYKIFVEICEQLGYRFTQNKNTEELFKVIQNIVNKKKAVFVFDETDKVQDLDFLYSILNDIMKKTIILITNYETWFSSMEARIKSRLMPERIEFKEYSKKETHEILKQRTGYAFVTGCWEKDALELISEKTSIAKDIRAGLFLLREAGLAAEEESSRKITKKHAEKAIKKIPEFNTKNPENLTKEAKTVLELIKENKETKIGDLYKIYQEKNGKGTYKTFQRRIEQLAKGGFINTKKVIGGKEGTTTIVSEKNRSLEEF